MTERIAARYRRFAEVEAWGRSPLYEALSLGVAGDPALLSFLAGLPPAKQQPNLLLAAMRFACGTPADYGTFRRVLLANADRVRAVMLARATQTNEPARCAVLLPVLARLPQPLALIEVGASAGLCLLPDRYGYVYDGGQLGVDSPMFACRLGNGMDAPVALPRVSWRAGLDLNPIDLRDDDQVAWLEALVWPDQPDRLARLRDAVTVARQAPPRVVRGNLLTDLPALAAEVRLKGTLVVFHTAVLAYVADPEARAAFARTVRDSGAVWVSNEAPAVFPEIAARAGSAPRPGAFLLGVDGDPVAWTDPHGAWAEHVTRPSTGVP